MGSSRGWLIVPISHHRLPSSSPAPSAFPPGRRALSEKAAGPVIEVRDLVRRFGDFVAVDHVSFQVAAAKSLDCLARTAPASRPRSACFAVCCVQAGAAHGSPEKIWSTPRPPRAPASATWRNGSHSMPSSRWWRTCAFSRASMG